MMNRGWNLTFLYKKGEEKMKLLAITIIALLIAGCAAPNAAYIDPLTGLIKANNPNYLEGVQSAKIAVVLTENTKKFVDLSKNNQKNMGTIWGKEKEAAAAYAPENTASLYMSIIKKYFGHEIVIKHSIEESKSYGLVILLDRWRKYEMMFPETGNILIDRGGLYFVDPINKLVLEQIIGEIETRCATNSKFPSRDEVVARQIECSINGNFALVNQIDVKLQSTMGASAVTLRKH
jgi:hypothetical protein